MTVTAGRLDYGRRRWADLAGLERPGSWDVDSALRLLRAPADSGERRKLIAWIRRDVSEPATDPDEMYRRVADTARGEDVFVSGRSALVRFGYGTLDGRVDSWQEARFLGLGNPWVLGFPRANDRVVDLGCGAGVDTALAAASGARVIGLDQRPPLLVEAAARATGEQRFVLGQAERCPLRDQCADLVVANGLPGIMALSLDVLGELRRILKPGSELRATVLLTGPDVPTSEVDDLAQVNALRYGKPLAAEAREALRLSGYHEVTLTEMASPFVAGFDYAEVRATLLSARRSS